MKNMFVNMLAILFIATTFIGCDDGEDYGTIPYAKVEFQFFLNEYTELRSYGGIVKFNGTGYNSNGVYVCQLDPGGGGAFLAFDATCPLEPDLKTAVEVKKDGILKLKCPRCGTEYDLQSDGRAKGKKIRLQRYAIRSFAFENGFQVYN